MSRRACAVRLSVVALGSRQRSSTALEELEGQDLLKNSEWPFPISSSDSITDRKSVFEGHASHLPSISHLPAFLGHITSSKRAKKATHRMYAYRTSGSNFSTVSTPSSGAFLSGQEDDGEGGSGERLSRLLELNDCKNVVVVVFRWYGGVKLGSDRWKRTSEAGKEALARGGFMKEKGNKSGKKKK
ncbi:ribosomal protein S5 domain 2-like protein [Neolentinus lepideus HHB14362 ss-1]|uniref:Ribosomal protein S5 domain 2-like protein n=1 Tax=Neolentinus lepideus HHB14362 ss-1 TaxID=1314782 RepID=A0A165TSZ2_9AGAM|nr:ribosomal protein S5 domain 2-like protein [Neolentinus lepideus HHB14362 ss-1]